MALRAIAKRFGDEFWAKSWAELSAFTSLAIIVPVIVGCLTQK
jgi:ABC-type glycerol-3-phosphate transport system permease component